jgi:uncharacterized SAM-binding protein YcdF (DUF218 family)
MFWLIRKILQAGFLLLFLVIAGLPVYYFLIPSQPTTNTSKTDAIIVLTGGAGRVAEGLKLLGTGIADKLLITGVDTTTSAPELVLALELPPEEIKKIDPTKITIGRKAQSTIGNAIEAADWVRANKVKSIRLVTANYHMIRATLEFKKLMPEIEIIQHPVFPKDFDAKNVKDDKNTQNLIIKEYFKFLYSWLVI